MSELAGTQPGRTLDRAAGLVDWGNVGGGRAIDRLRQVAVESEMTPLRHAVHVLPEPNAYG